uniref:Ig-like domain-containing protein n=1 Tax=Sinocyclocheilus anshuiensis TaxID=1608454 RepID=A0A671RJ37_9TELE
MLFCRVILSQLSVLLQWRSSGGISLIWSLILFHYHSLACMVKAAKCLCPAQDFRLVVPTGPVRTDSGSDIILPVHLSPETNAVSMEIRWFKGTELIYQYKNGQEMRNNDYKNRVSVSIQELRRGNLAPTLRNVQQSDSGDYTCKLFHDRCQKTGVIHLQVRK